VRHRASAPRSELYGSVGRLWCPGKRDRNVLQFRDFGTSFLDLADVTSKHDFVCSPSREGSRKRARTCIMPGQHKRCFHGRRKDKCKECTPYPHGRVKYHCAECNPCPHGKRKDVCAACNSCPHGKLKSSCSVCNSCPHGKRKDDCKECKTARAAPPSAKRIKREPASSPEIKQEPFTIRGYCGLDDGRYNEQ
jgi:hypothetical protein